MKGLVVGFGSIGRRHLENLITLDIDQLSICEIDPKLRAAASEQFGLKTFGDLNSAIDWHPQFAIVATPPHLHVEQCLLLARAGIDFLVEKPLSHTDSGLRELAESANRHQLVTMVGCNMRFHPGPAKIKDLLDQRRIGKVHFARLHCGSYLPNWRSAVDYRRNYAAHPNTGGGCLLDCIHEIDLAHWFLGPVLDVCCMADHLSALEIDTEDVAALICRHRSGTISEIHLDYVQREYDRGCQIVGDLGSIGWDFKAGVINFQDYKDDGRAVFSQPENWRVNEMYVDEIEHFLDCVRSRRPTMLPVSDAISVMQTAFAAKASAREHRVILSPAEALA